MQECGPVVTVRNRTKRWQTVTHSSDRCLYFSRYCRGAHTSVDIAEVPFLQSILQSGVSTQADKIYQTCVSSESRSCEIVSYNFHWALHNLPTMIETGPKYHQTPRRQHPRIQYSLHSSPWHPHLTVSQSQRSDLRMTWDRSKHVAVYNK